MPFCLLNAFRWWTAFVVLGTAFRLTAGTTLLNASFDISRELFQAYNPVFAAHWQSGGQGAVSINQSHAGSAKQARAVMDGLEADVVTFNLVTDIEVLVARGLVAANWRDRLPHQSVPFTSTIVFLTRKGNPKGIRDWPDLARPGVSVIVPNPKTSGNGKYSYLAAYGYALRTQGNDHEKAREFVTAIFRNAPVLDTGGRGASTSFVQREFGDVLLTFEAEVLLTLKEYGPDKFEKVMPSVSIDAEMPVTVVDRVVKRRGTAELASAYLEHLFSEAGQEIAAQNYYRPRLATVAQRHADLFPPLDLLSVDQVFGGWREATRVHFVEGGVFDQISARIARR